MELHINDNNIVEENEFENVQKEYNNLLKEISHTKDILLIKEKKANRLYEIMQSLCKHNWEMDKPEYGSKTTYTCSICYACSI